jgi:hypothetical protein
MYKQDIANIMFIAMFVVGEAQPRHDAATVERQMD